MTEHLIERDGVLTRVEAGQPDDVITILVEDYDALTEAQVIVDILRRAVLRDECMSNGMLRVILGMGAKPVPTTKGE